MLKTLRKKKRKKGVAGAAKISVAAPPCWHVLLRHVRSVRARSGGIWRDCGGGCAPSPMFVNKLDRAAMPYLTTLRSFTTLRDPARNHVVPRIHGSLPGVDYRLR